MKFSIKAINIEMNKSLGLPQAFCESPWRFQYKLCAKTKFLAKELIRLIFNSSFMTSTEHRHIGGCRTDKERQMTSDEVFSNMAKTHHSYCNQRFQVSLSTKAK